jgi:hypothetical protein
LKFKARLERVHGLNDQVPGLLGRQQQHRAAEVLVPVPWCR